MDILGPIASMVAMHGQRKKPSEIDIRQLDNPRHCHILVAVMKYPGEEEELKSINTAAEFNEVVELWKASPSLDLKLFFVKNEDRRHLSCEFIRYYGRKTDLEDPLIYKGLGWKNGSYWVAITNDFKIHPQGELFQKKSSLNEMAAINLGNINIYRRFLDAWKQDIFFQFDVYRLSISQGEQFRSIYPWWIERDLLDLIPENANKRNRLKHTS